MGALFKQHFAIAFPVFFVCGWLAITTILSVLSGWFALADQFPNRPEEPILKLKAQSASMGPGVSLQNIVTLGVCASGLRVGINRVFGPFSQDFFVPWREVTVTRSTFLFRPVAKLQLGNPAVGSLTVASSLAKKLARAAGPQWPEKGPFPEEKMSAIGKRLAKEWAAATLFAAFFFTVAPMMLAPNAEPRLTPISIVFPAVVFGIGAIIQYFRERE